MGEVLYCQQYVSPLGTIHLVTDQDSLLGAWFEGQKYEKRGFEKATFLTEHQPVLEEAFRWLDAYFSGQKLLTIPPLAPRGTTFQKRVWQELLKIPFGQTSTYGQLAKDLRCLSAQAVGGAVGKNPLSIFIPCHRILGVDGSLTGYAGGLERKSWLLDHERKRRK